MASEIEVFYYQRFIPEEGRGGEYHIRLNEDGKISDPMTPKQADAKGFTLSAIFADINAHILSELEATRFDLTAARQSLDEKLGELEAVKTELRAERVARSKAEKGAVA